MMYSKRSLAIYLIVAVVLFFSYRFFDQQFRYRNIQVSWPEEVLSLSSQERQFLEQLLDQPFYYLDRGKQSFVFSSQDGHYVLKFFDTRCLRSGAFPLLVPIDSERCAKKLHGLVIGYRLAWTRDREATGLLFVQLSSNPLNPFHVVVNDRFGLKHHIDLAKVPFILQARAIPTREVITALLKNGNVAEAETRFRQLIDMYVKEYRSGIIDGDHNVMYNTGFINGRPVRLDPGRLRDDREIEDPLRYTQDLHKVFVERVGKWLNRHFPQYQQSMSQAINEQMLPIR